MKSLTPVYVEELKYVGEKRKKLYNKLGVFTIKDLIYYCPREYIDLSKISYIVDASLNEGCAIKVTIINKMPPAVVSRKGLVIYKIYAKDESSDIVITLFNEHYTFNKLQINNQYVLFGKVVKNYFNGKCSFEISSPIIEDAKNECKFIPIYPLTAGLTSKMVFNNVSSALKIQGLVKEYLPSYLLKELELLELNTALNNIHFPNSFKDIESARKRIVFDELFIFSLSLILIRKNNLTNTSFAMKNVDMSEFYKSIEFELTKSQKKVIQEILNDMSRNIPMNRLLQGDVGSGKTIVAMASIYLAVKNKAQVAFMAPTEILAKQHFDSVNKVLSLLGIRVGILLGSMSTKQKREEKEKIELGQIDIIVGTHAILQDTVIFKNLGLVITDEQHRFGVKQRNKLSEKGKNPHRLVMSATPIPRTLSLIIYGDLDISVIDELPSNRKQVLTYYIDEKKRKRAYGFIKKLIDEGRQAYIVCPVIEQNEESNLKSVIEYGENLKTYEFSNYKVAVLHGKTATYEKDVIMQKFQKKEIDLLVSTTVIEVGVDVPNAAVMLIENADRFGLSQLHQLRGRVGRGEYQSYCILVSESKFNESVNKLKMMTKVYDGFEIAQYDLKIRGPGDFFGNRQHGLPKFKNFDMIKDIDILKLSQEAAIKVLADDYKLQKAENQKIKELVLNLTEGMSF